MQQTSLFAYYKLKEENELGRRERQVYDLFKQCGNMTNQEISIRLDLPINHITGRTNSLVKYGLLEKKEIISQNNNRPAIRWGVI